MIVEAIVSASYGNKSHPHVLYLSKAQISDIASQNTRGLRVLHNHKGSPIGYVLRMYKDERDNLVAIMKITDKNIKKGILNKTIIGASPKLISFAQNDIYIIAKGLSEISLTEDQELPESLITNVKLEDEDRDLDGIIASFDKISVDENGSGNGNGNENENEIGLIIFLFSSYIYIFLFLYLKKKKT